MNHKSAYRKILKFCNNYPHVQNGEYSLISDSLYLIKQCVFCISKPFKGKNADAVKSYLNHNSFEFSENSFICFFTEQGRHLKTSEVYALADTLNCFLICEIARQCEAFFKNGKGNYTKIAKAISSLRAVADMETDSIFTALCPTEKLFMECEGFAVSDSATKTLYREALISYSKRHFTTEYKALYKAIKGGKGQRLLSYLSPFSKIPAFFYYLFSLTLTLGITVVSVYFFGFTALFGVLPVAEGVFCVSDLIFSRFVKAKCPPRIDSDKIPDDSQTLIVITTLLFGKEKDGEIFERLEEFYLKNRHSNLKFGILGDFPDSKLQVEEHDGKTVENAVFQTEKLNREYGNIFSLFVRNRVKNSDGLYGGFERKRGAVTQLISAINGGSMPDICVCPYDLTKTDYLLTLDSDTDLPIDGAYELLSVALHPENTPVLKDGKIASGYGIFQPLMKTRLSETSKTYHSLFGANSAKLYESASFDRYQTLLGSGVFCGKGLINTRLFNKLVTPSLPNGIILSHDIIEGGILRCMLVSDTSFCDSTPKNSISYFRRQHRWVRGDMQNLWFVGSGTSNKSLNFRILENFRRLLTPIMSALGIAVCSFFAPLKFNIPLFLLFTVNIWITAIPTLFSVFFGKTYTPRRFFSRCVGTVTGCIMGLFYSVCSLAENAYINTDAAIRSAWRMLVSKKHLLSWVTFSQTDTKSITTPSAFIQNHVFGVFAGTVITAFSPFPIYKLCGLMWFFFPLVAYFMAANVTEYKKTLTDKDKSAMISYAREIFSFFQENVTEKTNYLPPDNVQYSPTHSVAYRTSPTNIGLYLCCLLCARDFGFITSENLAQSLEKTVSTLQVMEKSHGHLYNWYDIKTLSPIGGKYISAVDSGNFSTSLIAVANGILSYSSECAALNSLSEKIAQLANSPDYSILYNKRKNLLYLGCDQNGAPQGDICYDMLISEIRTTCFWLCATGKAPKKLWQSLSRTITCDSGYIGMISWAGSCFEYFMPELFLSREKNSFIDETMHFAAFVQKKHKKHGVFGISESGYFSFNPDMNYRYKAHGVPKLALKRYSRNSFVVSPYSSFLMINEIPSAALKNLGLLDGMGCRGKHGFYEALDLSQSESIVQSYMAHHLGMSLISLTNACFDNAFVKRFMAPKEHRAYRELLAESIPKNALLYTGETQRMPIVQNPRQQVFEAQSQDVMLTKPSACFISESNLTLIATSSGHIKMNYGFFAVNSCSFDLYNRTDTAGFVFYHKQDKKAFTPLERNTDFSFEYSGGHFSYTSSSPDFPASVMGCVYKNTPCFAFKTRASADKFYSVGFSFTPVLQGDVKYSSHPNFENLFVEASYDGFEKILHFSRRGGNYPHIAIALSNPLLTPKVTSSLEHLRAHSVDDISDMFSYDEKAFKSGSCINPICCFMTPEIKGGEAVFLVACGQSKSECEGQIRRARLKDFPKSFRKPTEGHACKLLTKSIFSQPASKLFEANSSILWRFSLSGNYPLAVVELFSESEAVSKFAQSYLSLKQAFIETELLFIIHEQEKYYCPLKEFVLGSIGEECSRFMFCSAGIAIASAEDISKSEIDFLRSFASVYEKSDGTEAPEPALPQYIPPEIITESPASSPEFSYDTKGEVSDSARNHFAPYSYVMAGYSAGCVVTHKTLGFAFWRNARECKLTEFDGNGYAKFYGIRIMVSYMSKLYDIVSYAKKTVYKDGVCTYLGDIDGNGYTLSVYARSKLPAVEYSLKFDNNIMPQTIFTVNTPRNFSSEYKNGLWVYKNMKHTPVEFCGFIKCSSAKHKSFSDSARLFGGADAGKNDIMAISCNQNKVIFAIGGVSREKQVFEVAKRCAVKDKQEEAMEFVKSQTPDIVLNTGNSGLDSLFSKFAPYQAAISRFYGKTGFYQTGGAYGFRDQLQDCFCLIYSNPKAVRTHLLRCAAHQYREGDVMHWWFKSEKGDTGIRTKCSDDFLFLPLALSNYVEKTGDTDILQIQIPYMESPPLESGERYETPSVSPYKESVYMHCIRAMANGEKTGAHGLSLMGSCDWNDGMSKIGALGRGESVFTSFLYVYTCKKFIPIMKLMNDTVSLSHFASISASLVMALEQYTFEGDRYIRAFDDNGIAVGSKSSNECKIDILSQAFAAMVLGKTERTQKAMESAINRLFSRKDKLLMLFTPPFDKYDAGYISSYCKGVRENGGQYTHGALWGVLGLIKCGKLAEALEVLSAIMPFSHSNEEIYRVEPYVIAADIYSGEKAGRGGWTWYTGSASWFFVIMLEEILGIHFTNAFKTVEITPITDYSLTLSLPSGKLSVTVSPLFSETTLNGKKASFPLDIPVGDNVLQVKTVINK